MAKVFRIDRQLPVIWQQALEGFLARKRAQGVAPTALAGYSEHVTWEYS
ncbi:MAG: hypothetical protein AB1563_05335 [Bacillota bacterium]